MGQMENPGCEDMGKVDDEPYTDIILVNFIDDRLAFPEWEKALIGRTILFEGDNKILFSTLPLNKHHVDHVKKLAGWKRVLNIYPTNPTDDTSICEDLMEQTELNSILKRVLSNSPGVNIIPVHRATFCFNFFEYLRNLGFNFRTPETMDFGTNFVADYYDTKSGFRAAFSSILSQTTVRIPEGFIVFGKQEVADACYVFKLRNKSCVIKQDKGFSGEGIAFVDHQQFSPHYKKFKQQMMGVLDDEKCKAWGSWATWDKCCVVEEMVDIDKDNLQGVISVEYQVLDGKVYPLNACTMLMEADGKTFKGTLMSPEVEENPLTAETLKAARLFSEIVASQGYKGFLDMDCLISKDGHVYALESNVRRTGGTHIHQFLVNLIGPDYMNRYWCADEEIRFGEDTTMLEYQTYFQLLEDLMLKRDPELQGSEQRWRGVLLANPDMIIMKAIDVIIVASSGEDLGALRNEVQDRLDSAHSKLCR